ncbi:MAG TPA: alkaline phosphatase family protein, partial [Gemmatimonadaceae bacterium]|nr:alkaline phosphatase family protein [Gemmatimonadaceae bacterium]
MRLSALLSLRLVLPTAAVLVSACAGAQPSGGSAAGPTATMAAPAEAPKLIVLIVVDQLRGEMLDRYRPSLSGGYLRLMNEGAWYSNAFQDHAITETAPGHASVLSGRFPASTGIISNSAGVIDSRYPLVTGLSSEVGASPDRFQGTTLVDWLVARDARSRALSVSAKDRAAILPVGRSKQEVYWYSVNGSFTTSDYYRDSLPPWVVAFNGRRLPHRYAGAVWDLAKSPSAYPEPDSVVFENRGSDFVFPHAFPADSDQAASVIRITPTIDSITALFALEGLERLALGRGPQTDVMSVSFSATDYIGHQYGPDSREAHDNAIRLDQTLAWFLDSLFKVRDPSTVMIALTGDHGVQPIPELARERGLARKNEAQ